MSVPLLDVRELSIRIPRGANGYAHPVRGLSFTVPRGETVALVGESGAGKSSVCSALMGLLPAGAKQGGSVLFDGKALRPHEVRGDRLAMVFQDPLGSLNPYVKVGRQLSEVLEVHRGVTGRAARRAAIEMLERMGVADADQRFDHYPHQMSGGIRQRVVLAMALLVEPELLIADEPTVSLDVTTEAQILELLRDLSHTRGTSILYVAHEPAVIAHTASFLHVMYAGRIIESGPTERVLAHAAHPYTRALIAAVPHIDGDAPPVPIAGNPPEATAPDAGCAFAPRCALARSACLDRVPRLEELADQHRSRCPVVLEEMA